MGVIGMAAEDDRMAQEDVFMPWTPVMAQGLGLMDGNCRDDETAIAPYRPGDPADLRAMPGQKEREQP